MKTGLIACVPLASAAALPEGSDFAKGMVEGLISDKGDATHCIAEGATPVVTHAMSGAQDFLTAIKNRDDAMLVKAAMEMGDACEGLEPMLTSCDDAHTDVLGILEVLKQIKGPVDLIKHMGDDLTHDTENIIAELDKAFKAYSQKNWNDFGNHLGQFLHRIVIGKFTDGEGRRLNEAELPPVGDLLAFGIPFVSAILSDKPDFMMCALGGLPMVTGLTHFGADFKEALTHHNMTALTMSVKDASEVCDGAAGIKSACAPVGEDVQEIVRVMKTIENVAGLLDHIITNLKENVDNIADDMYFAFKAFRKEPRDLGACGEHLGKAMHRLIIEKYPSDVAVLV